VAIVVVLLATFVPIGQKPGGKQAVAQPPTTTVPSVTTAVSTPVTSESPSPLSSPIPAPSGRSPRVATTTVPPAGGRPTPSFVTPTEGESVSGVVNIQVRVTNPSKISEVEFKVDSFRCYGYTNGFTYTIGNDPSPDGDLYEIRLDTKVLTDGCIVVSASPHDRDNPTYIYPHGDDGIYLKFEIRNYR
jgi:Bacterial Ig domain